jgi:hypothetical protein
VDSKSKMSDSKKSPISSKGPSKSTKKGMGTPPQGRGIKQEDPENHQYLAHPEGGSVKSDGTYDLGWLDCPTGSAIRSPKVTEVKRADARSLAWGFSSSEDESSDDSLVERYSSQKHKKSKKSCRHDSERDRLDGEWRELKEKKEELFEMMKQIGVAVSPPFGRQFDGRGLPVDAGGFVGMNSGYQVVQPSQGYASYPGYGP